MFKKECRLINDVLLVVAFRGLFCFFLTQRTFKEKKLQEP